LHFFFLYFVTGSPNVNRDGSWYQGSLPLYFLFLPNVNNIKTNAENPKVMVIV